MNLKEVDKQYPGFADEVSRLSAEEINARIVEMQKGLEESESHKEANEELKQARDTVTELSGPYRDVKKAVKIKTKYLLELLKEKGK